MMYYYTVVRYVPDPVRGEFLNIGVLAGSEEAGDWAFRQVSNPSRARRLDKDLFKAAWGFLNEMAEAVQTYSEAQNDGVLPSRVSPVSLAWLKSLAADLNNLVQCGPILPVSADSAEDAVDAIFDLVIDSTEGQSRAVDRRRARAALQSAYRLYIPRENVMTQPLLRVGDSVEFIDLAVANGRVVQVAQTWSFQIKDQFQLANQVQSWGWAIERLRERGGVLESAPGGVPKQIDVPANCDVAVVYVPPRDEAAEGWRAAEGVFKALRIEACKDDEAESVAARAASLLGRSES